MKTKQSGQNIEFLFNMLLFCTFAFLTLSVLLAGVRAYRTFATRMDDNFFSRTATGYVTNKVRQYDMKDGIQVTQLEDGSSALILSFSTLPDYQTLIYCSDGAIRELFARADAEVDLSSGMEIVKAKSISFQLEGQQLIVLAQSVFGNDIVFNVALTSA